MASHVLIASRFNGPQTTGNGGYSCGVLAAELGDSAEVTLRKPPPLDRALQVARRGDTLELMDADVVIASARIAQPDVTIPEPPSYQDALLAEAQYEGLVHHNYPTCFVCGPAREDGLRLFTGKVADRALVACTWTPDHSVGVAGAVDPRVVWSALDCPTYFAGTMMGYGRWALLGRQTATLCGPLRVGEPHIVTAWPIGKDGRKWEGGSAIFDRAGQLRAFARGLWIEIPPPS
ncbi:MAG TPA: hypothetical protein VI299_22860 [Polyangiales bacterium]